MTTLNDLYTTTNEKLDYIIDQLQFAIQFHTSEAEDNRKNANENANPGVQTIFRKTAFMHDNATAELERFITLCKELKED